MLSHTDDPLITDNDIDIEFSDTFSDDEDENEDMDFEDFKALINSKNTKHHRDRFFASLLSTDSLIFTTQEDKKNELKSIKNATIPIVENKPPVFRNPYTFMNDLKKSNDILDQEIAAKELAKIKQQLSCLQTKILKIYELSQKIDLQEKNMQQMQAQEDRLWKKRFGIEVKINTQSHRQAIESDIQSKNQEFVDYILSEMAGIKDKDSIEYKDLSKISYITLVTHMNKFINSHMRRHPEKYKRFELIQRSFLTHLYHRVLGKHLPVIHHETKHEILTISEPVSARSVVIEEHAEIQLSIFDRFIEILGNVLNFLRSCFSCSGRTHNADQAILTRDRSSRSL